MMMKTADFERTRREVVKTRPNGARPGERRQGYIGKMDPYDNDPISTNGR